MKTLVTTLALLAALTGYAEAQAFGLVNPSRLSFTAPTTNADGTPLQDLSGYNVRVVGPLPTAATTCPAFLPTVYLSKKTIPSTTTSPVANTTVFFGTAGSTTLPADLGITVDGQYCAVVSAVDLTLIEGAASSAVPFVLNKQAPAAPSALQFLP